MTHAELEFALLVFLYQCVRFLWKVEIERHKMRKKNPSATPNRRRTR